MPLSSFSFLLFFSIVVVVHFAIPPKYRWLWILISSYCFYGFSAMEYALILAVITLFSFFTAKRMDAASVRKEKKTWLMAGIVFNLGILFTFKYFLFFIDSVEKFVSLLGFSLKFRGMELIYPIGLSFITFQILAYLIDVYNGKSSAEHHFGHYASYVAFFPKLLMGPIERYEQFIPQIRSPRPFSTERFRDGAVRIGWGLFKKLVVSNRMAVLVDTVFAAPGNWSPPQLVFTIIILSLQMYIDFSAYCDIAIGAAKILGIDLTENFAHPYFALSVAEFWRRWHISFSNWLRDYIFIPLNFKHRRKKPKMVWMCLDLMITFLISGLWHGANWTFIFWGFLHGFYQCIEYILKPLPGKIVKQRSAEQTTFAHRFIKALFTFSLISMAWVFFRADSIQDGYSILRYIFIFKPLVSASSWVLNEGVLGLQNYDFSIMLYGILSVTFVEVLQTKFKIMSFLKKQPIWFRWAVYYVLIFSFLIFGMYGENTNQQFVYFQF